MQRTSLARHRTVLLAKTRKTHFSPRFAAFMSSSKRVKPAVDKVSPTEIVKLLGDASKVSKGESKAHALAKAVPGVPSPGEWWFRVSNVAGDHFYPHPALENRFGCIRPPQSETSGLV
jgi:hypothetical protein